MSAIITAATKVSILSSAFDARSAGVGLLAILVLTLLLVEQEFLRASGAARSRRSMLALDIAIAPLLLVFILVVLVRLSEIFHLK